MTEPGRTRHDRQRLADLRRRALPAVPAAPTIGAEEEFFLVDTATRQASARAPEVLARATTPAPAVSGDSQRASRLCAEITRFQVEAASPVCWTARELYGHLTSARRALTEAASGCGLAVAATGTVVIGDSRSLPLTAFTDTPRYRTIAGRFGALRDAHAVCGCHVHVGIGDREAALGAANRLRPWLPALLALTANSPFQRGRDTGHASWRWVTWARLPSAGPPPLLDSLADYENAVADMLAAGAILDPGMVYWDVRLSARLPTLEVRVGDVAATADEAVLAAILVRGLAAVGLGRAAAGEPDPVPDDRPLRLAMWRAAHDGLEGLALDPVSRELVPARRRVERMLRAAAPGLPTDEADLAESIVSRIMAVGSGAHRQRAAYARRGRTSDVVDLVTRQAAHGLTAVEE